MKAALMFVLAAATVFGQAHDLSGVWGREGGGSTKVYTFEQQEATVKIALESRFAAGSLTGGISGANTYAVDGVERATQSPNGRTVWTTVNWQGDSLVIQRVTKDGYRVAVSRESWSLIDGGNGLKRTLRCVNMDGVEETSEVLQRR